MRVRSPGQYLYHLRHRLFGAALETISKRSEEGAPLERVRRHRLSYVRLTHVCDPRIGVAKAETGAYLQAADQNKLDVKVARWLR